MNRFAGVVDRRLRGRPAFPFSPRLEHLQRASFGTILLLMKIPVEKRDWRRMSAMFHTIAPSYVLLYPRLLLWDGPALEEGMRGAGGATRESAGARPGIRHGRLFPPGRAAVSRRPVPGRRPDRAHAATRPGGAASLAPSAPTRNRFPSPTGFSMASSSVTGCAIFATCRRWCERFERVTVRRADGEPGTFSCREPLAAAAVSRLALRAGRLLWPVCCNGQPRVFHL